MGLDEQNVRQCGKGGRSVRIVRLLGVNIVAFFFATLLKNGQNLLGRFVNKTAE
jgi:hypothetical protein